MRSAHQAATAITDMLNICVSQAELVPQPVDEDDYYLEQPIKLVSHSSESLGFVHARAHALEVRAHCRLVAAQGGGQTQRFGGAVGHSFGPGAGDLDAWAQTQPFRDVSTLAKRDISTLVFRITANAVATSIQSMRGKFTSHISTTCARNLISAHCDPGLAPAMPVVSKSLAATFFSGQLSILS
jgi:hypothetical protein